MRVSAFFLSLLNSDWVDFVAFWLVAVTKDKGMPDSTPAFRLVPGSNVVKRRADTSRNIIILNAWSSGRSTLTQCADRP